ncbi:MAG: hypothetical protein DMD53_07740 [Gemmatimonadetes bacterium]|nr:MAG: hypothetical protein DMD53_07740 [Gemmatimonadota bacterium]
MPGRGQSACGRGTWSWHEGKTTRGMPVRLYAHLTWATLQRQSLISPAVAEFLRRFLPREAQRHGARLLAAGIVADHVHVVVQLPAINNIPRLVQGLKGPAPGSSIGRVSCLEHRCVGRRATIYGVSGSGSWGP